MSYFKSIRVFAISGLITLSVLAFQNCADYSIIQNRQVLSQSVNSDFCLKPPETVAKYSKIVFVMDKSGSNVSGNGGGGTDPNKTIRVNAVKDFLEKYRDDPFYKWAFIKFHNGRAEALIDDGSGKAIFSDAAAVDQALEDFEAEADQGDTPYIAALGTVDSLIAENLKEFPEEVSTYNIFFMSDGRPTPGSSDGCDTADCAPILNQVKNIRAKDASNIFLSTVYYYGAMPDPVAGTGLEKMADVGGGTYSNAGNGEPVIFREVKTGERPEPWVIKGNKLIAYNMNSAFCSDSTIDSDSDADGICDKDEILYNTKYKVQLDELYPGKKFDPFNRNSLHEDYSDSFVWKFDLTNTSSGLSECSNKKADEDFDLLNSCEEALLKDLSSANGPTNEWTERMLAISGGSADPNNFDTDGDLFLDVIEFFQFRLESAISSAVDYNSIENMYAGNVNAETLMLEHRHFMRANQFGKENYKISTYPKGINEDTGEQCYGFQLDRIALYPTGELSDGKNSDLSQLTHFEDENKILIYFIATEENQRHSPGILFHKMQTLNYNSPINLDTNFNINDFKTYKVPRFIQ